MSRHDDKGLNFYLEMDPETDEGAASSEPGAWVQLPTHVLGRSTAVALEARRRKRCVGAGGGTTSWARRSRGIGRSQGCKPRWTPPMPTARERREHEASGHAVYRSWCEECVNATGMVQQHRRKVRQEEEFYLEGSKPNLVAVDRGGGGAEAERPGGYYRTEDGHC